MVTTDVDFEGDDIPSEVRRKEGIPGRLGVPAPNQLTRSPQVALPTKQTE